MDRSVPGYLLSLTSNSTIFHKIKHALASWLERKRNIILVARPLKEERFLLVSLLFSFLLSLPQAQADFFNIFEKILGRTNGLGSNGINSQTIPLLSAPLNANLLAGIGGGDINIVQNSALLPVTGPLGSLADVAELKSDAISLYVVREGDTVSGIADIFDVSVNTVRWANNLRSGGLITPGQVLVILPVSGVQYTIKKGDTISGIAKKFGGDASEILSFNDLNPNAALEAGDTIIIPDGEAEAIQAPSQTSRQLTQSSPAYQGYYIRPVNPSRKTQGIHGYNGVDLASSCGSPVMASASGNVLIARPAGWNGGYGQYIAIAHANGTQTLYAHLRGIIVSPGWNVVQGQVIGYVGSTGQSTGCHLHFEVRGARNQF